MHTQGNVITPPLSSASGVRASEGCDRARWLSDLLPGRWSSVILSTSTGVATARIDRDRLSWLQRSHVNGRTRLGMSPVRPDGSCRWGAIDLDAHDEAATDRFADAQAVARGLAALDLTPYLVRSRGGRGYHVWVLFDEPGVRAADLYALLDAFRSRVLPADVFPSGPTGIGNKIFLPAFGGAPLLTHDCDLVDLEHVEPDDPAHVPCASGRADRTASTLWPPLCWRGSVAGRPGFPAYLNDVKHLLTVGADGLWRARIGARNRIAGAVAGRILRHGGDFAAFLRWDLGNEPPLASDKPEALKRWWASAVRKVGGRPGVEPGAKQ